MRQRKVRNEEERIAGFSAYIAENPAERRGRWQTYFSNTADLYIEIGCGKGKFILAMAEKYPERNFIAVEGNLSVMLRALEKAHKAELTNVLFIGGYIRDMGDYFEPGEIAGIYLNFSDPWPKERHAKRRLTYRTYLDGYRRVLKPGGAIEFKTDNDGLFAFSLEEIQESGLTLSESTEDLHGTDLPARLITTEYEEKFKGSGKNINYCKVVV